MMEYIRQEQVLIILYKAPVTLGLFDSSLNTRAVPREGGILSKVQQTTIICHVLFKVVEIYYQENDTKRQFKD